MGLREEIFGYLDDGMTTLVFPTENAARHWLSMYVRQRRTSVLADRAIALDSFKELFSPVHEERPANRYHRLAFVSDLLASRSSGLKYLFNDSFYGFRRRFIPLIVRILPNLIQMDRIIVRDKALYSDLQILKRRYGAFLEQKNLFEPGWEKCSIQNYKGPKLNHVLVGFDCDIQMQRLMDELGDPEGVGKIVLGESGKSVYRQYMTEESELEDLFCKLHDMKLEDVATSDIIISTPSIEGLRPRLERKALEYGIPISFMGSVDISKTVPGRYLQAVMLCLTERLSFRSMENLLTNSSFPYKEMNTNRSLVRFMIDHNIRSGSLDMKDDPLFSALQRFSDSNTLDFYKRLKGNLNALRKAQKWEKLSVDLHVLTSFLFGPEEFNEGPDEDRDVYAFILSELSSLGRTLSEISLVMDDMFSIFMDTLENLSYVPQDARTGIRVYRYGQDPLLFVPYHFVIGLNDANARIVESDLDFLQDHEVVSRKTYDVSQKMLDYYSISGEHVSFSGSAESFDGSAASPTQFVLAGLVEHVHPEFEDVIEKADIESLNMAVQTAFSPKGEDVSRGAPAFARDPDSTRLSYSTINSYAKCPYVTLLEKYFLAGAPDHFEPADQDDREIGSFLHNVIQAFMQAHMGSFVVPQDIDQYHDEIESILDRMLEENHVFDPYMKKSIRGYYIDSLKKALDIMLIPPDGKKGKLGYVGAFKPLRNEYKLGKNPSFIGYIDTIIMDLEGRIHLLDYKKGDVNSSYQLVLYRRLYDENPQFGADVGECLFYIMGNSAFKGLDDKKWEQQSLKLDEDLEKIRDGYSKGLWGATPSKNSCKMCKERSVCRRRFNLQ